MLYEKLVKYCLQYLEQSSDMDVMNIEMSDLENDDVFAEYLYNLEHSIYTGMIRYAQSLVLPVCVYDMPTGNKSCFLTSNSTKTGKRLFKKIKEIYATDETGEIHNKIDYYIIGNQVILKNVIEGLEYHIIYHPTILSLDNYIGDNQSIYDIDLDNIDGNGLCIPDEMAINIKFLVYSELKIEDNPTVANINKNYFETYLEECKNTEVENNQNEAVLVGMSDMYGD